MGRDEIFGPTGLDGADARGDWRLRPETRQLTGRHSLNGSLEALDRDYQVRARDKYIPPAGETIPPLHIDERQVTEADGLASGSGRADAAHAFAAAPENPETPVALSESESTLPSQETSHAAPTSTPPDVETALERLLIAEARKANDRRRGGLAAAEAGNGASISKGASPVAPLEPNPLPSVQSPSLSRTTSETITSSGGRGHTLSLEPQEENSAPSLGAPVTAPVAREAPRAKVDMKRSGQSPAAPPAGSSMPPAKKGKAPAGATGGGGGGAGSIQRRGGGDPDFRHVLSKGLAACRRNLVTVAVFSIVVNLLILCVPIYLFQVSDRVLTSRSTDTLMMLTIIVVGAVFAHVFLDMMRRLILMRIAVEAETKLGAPVLSAAARASYNGSSREFQVLSDLQHMRNFITGSVLLTMFDAPVAPVYLLVVFLIHPDLGYIVAGASLLLLVIAVINQKITAVPYATANAYAVRANLQADAMARNAQVINAMGMIPESVMIWGKETAESLRNQVRAQDRNILLSGVTKFIRLSTQIAMLGWGAWLALSGHLTGGMIIAASMLASRALGPIEGTIDGWKHFVQARSAYGRIRTLLKNSPLNMERLRLPRPVGRLSVERILYVPPPNKKVILNGVNFTLEPGEALAIVGPSGAGKSTLAKMLVGSITPTAGNIRLDMMDLRNWDPRQFGESVGYLPQDVQLFPGTIKANIARMREGVSDEEVFDAAEMADVHGLISHFAQGYETFVAMDGSPLSGGQKQRIGLARAFFGKPRLIVLDEPNSNLDVPGELALAQSMLRAKKEGMTVVAVTQRPALLKSVDKILMIKDGTVEAFGKRDEVISLLQKKKLVKRAGGVDDAPTIDAAE